MSENWLENKEVMVAVVGAVSSLNALSVASPVRLGVLLGGLINVPRVTGVLAIALLPPWVEVSTVTRDSPALVVEYPPM